MAAKVLVRRRGGGERRRRYLGDERFEPFWAAAEETGALVFIHPTTRGFDAPVFGDYYLWNTVGNPLETTITAAHMVMAGVLERHPGLRVVLAHGGGALPALRGRLRHAHGRSSRRPARGCARTPRRRSRGSTSTPSRTTRRCCARWSTSRRRPRAAGHRPPVRHGRPASGGHRARRRPRRRAERDVLGGTALRLLEREGGAHVTADVVVAGAGHNSLITAAYLAASGREVHRARHAARSRAAARRPRSCSGRAT